MVLAGYTGLVSLGHAAFLGIGAYAHVYFLAGPGAAVGGLGRARRGAHAGAGVLVGLPALRMTGVYLTIATLAFALIIQEVFSRWEHVTHGLKGRPVDKPVSSAVSLASGTAFYFLCLAVADRRPLAHANLLRAPTGRAWVAIRDSEIAAQSHGRPPRALQDAGLRLLRGLMGAAGALFAHQIGFLAPDIFSVLLSIQFLLMVVVGGLGSLHGALYGAVFVAMLPVLISEMRDYAPQWIGHLAAARQGRGRRRVPRGGALRQAARPRARHLRPHPGALHPVRAARRLRAMGEARTCLLHFPALQARHLQAPEDLHALGAPAVSFFAVDDLGVQLRRHPGRRRRVLRGRGGRRSSRSSGPTARARPRSST